MSSEDEMELARSEEDEATLVDQEGEEAIVTFGTAFG